MKKFKILLILVIILIAFFNIDNFMRLLYPFEYKDYVLKYADRYDLDPYLVVSVIKNESNFDKNAKSSKDARGLMQITPDTAKWIYSKMDIGDIDIEKLYDPEFNIAMGCWYLNDLNKEFDNKIDLVLAAYNAGRGNVQKWLQSSEHSKDGENLYYIPYEETDKYVKKVKVSINIYKMLYSDNKVNNIQFLKYLYDSFKS